MEVEPVGVGNRDVEPHRSNRLVYLPSSIPVGSPVFLDHRLRHIPVIADRRRTAGATIRASSSATVTSTIRIVWTGAVASIMSYRIGDDRLLYVSVTLRLRPWSLPVENQTGGDRND